MLGFGRCSQVRAAPSHKWVFKDFEFCLYRFFFATIVENDVVSSAK